MGRSLKPTYDLLACLGIYIFLKGKDLIQLNIEYAVTFGNFISRARLWPTLKNMHSCNPYATLCKHFIVLINFPNFFYPTLLEFGMTVIEDCLNQLQVVFLMYLFI